MPLGRLIAASPADVSVDQLAMAALFDRVSQEVSQGRVEGCQVAIARHGRLAGCASFGWGGGKPVNDETLFACFSCTKATGGIAVCQLLEQGLLSLDERVADIIPEFGTHGKEAVTVQQLVTFTAGFPNPAGNRPGGDNLIVPADFSTSSARCAEFAKWQLAWPPGSKWEYHVRAETRLTARRSAVPQSAVQSLATVMCGAGRLRSLGAHGDCRAQDGARLPRLFANENSREAHRLMLLRSDSQAILLCISDCL